MTLTTAILTAFILDLIFGDPKWLPHPVRWMGKFISRYENGMRATAIPLWLSGIILALVLPAISYAIAWGVIYTAGTVDPEWAWIVEVILIYQCISVRALYDETKPVYQALMRKDMLDARRDLSMVVGRDTQNLNDKEVSRAVVETVAESTVDGIFTPLLFAAIGGAPLAMAYKAVSTLDSMVGYNNEQYANFGWASARLDDLCNYFPARIALLIIPLAAYCCRFSAGRSLQIGVRERLKHNSPNAGHAEAAFAGALNVQLGGTNYYQGVESVKPAINAKERSCLPTDIPAALKLMGLSSFLFLIMIIFVRIQFFS